MNLKAVLCCASLALCVGAGAREPVKYRGLFINDEDWGLRPWAVRHFGKDEGIGVRAYEDIFALMKADGLNLLWPAMHEGGYEFVSRPENMALAARHGIRVGTSHCEPMLRNNCYLPKADKQKWSWTKHKSFIKDYWQWAVDRYATNDVLWTVGMRGIHDGKMNDGDTMAEKIAVLEDVFAAQCGMLAAAGAGDAPKLFVPYKEVLPIFNAGLKVPPGTTIMWVNDNFGYVRRLGGPQCAGYGGGIYWHTSYHGRPHGYIHLCTTPPAFMWYELVAKCAQNGVRDVWMVNAGDVFQADVILYALGKFAADPDHWATRPDAQSEVLGMWVRERLQIGRRKTSSDLSDAGANAPALEVTRALASESEESELLNRRIVSHLNEYYALGFIRKPEHMCLQWSRELPDDLKAELLARYKAFLDEDIAIEKEIQKLQTANCKLQTLPDAYFRLVGYQARFLAHAGLIHLEGRDAAYARSVIDPLTARWDAMDGGKWAGFWCDTIGTAGDNVRQPSQGNRWSTQMQWPWNEPKNADGTLKPRTDYVATAYRWERQKGLTAEPRWLEPSANTPAPDGGAWTEVKGLGTSGRALALLPVKPGAGIGASVAYELAVSSEQLAVDGASGKLLTTNSSLLTIQFLPDFALWPGLGLGVEVQFDDGERRYVAVPKSDSNIGEKDSVRNAAVQDNFIRVTVPIPDGSRRVRIVARDPGVVLDRVGLR